MNGKSKGFWGWTLGLLLIQGALYAQEPILIAYERNFLRANLSSKAGILRDAATDEQAPEFIGPLYEFALSFALQNEAVLREDPDLIILTQLAVRGVGTTGYHAGAETLWQVFSVFRDSAVRVEVLNALARMGGGNQEITNNLNQYLGGQNAAFSSGTPPDYPALSACLSALGALGNSSSFPALFTVITSRYPEGIVQEAYRALDRLQGNYQPYLLDIIRQGSPRDKLAAFTVGNRNGRLTNSQQGELAELALEIGAEILPTNPEDEEAAAALRYASVRSIRDLRWTRATALVIRHYYRVQRDYTAGAADREHFLEAVSCLGAMGSSEAAQVLSLQLGLLNSLVERNGEFDEAVVLALVNALGEIGDKAAFDYLLYISYLTYPEPIQTAAKEALNRLKW
jgi:HEAT repeat protein